MMVRRFITEILAFVVALAVWQVLSMAHIWPEVLFPSPLQVLGAFRDDLLSGILLLNLGVSLKSLLLGFIVGCFLAVPLGYLMGLSRTSRDFFDPLVNLLQLQPEETVGTRDDIDGGSGAYRHRRDDLESLSVAGARLGQMRWVGLGHHRRHHVVGRHDSG